MSASRTLTMTGIPEVDRTLKKLGTSDARKAARTGVNAGMSVLAKFIRAEVKAEPDASRNLRKQISKTIGKRFRKNRRTGESTAKVGPGVGKQTPATGSRRPGRKGLSKQNVHWFVLGTKDRRVRTTGNPAGRLQSIHFVRRGVKKASSEVGKTMRQKTLDRIKVLLKQKT